MNKEVEDAHQQLEELFQEEVRLKSEIVKQSIFFHGNGDKGKKNEQHYKLVLVK